MSNKRKTCLLLLCFGVLLYGTYLGLIPLLDPDEPVYGETAKEMLLTGDWLSPRIYGEFWYDKPPFIGWKPYPLSCSVCPPGQPVCLLYWPPL